MESLWAREYRELKRLDAYLRGGLTGNLSTSPTASQTAPSSTSDSVVDTSPES